jgi:beta-lactamase class A
MRNLGMEQSALGRKMQGRPAEGTQAENWATAGEYARLVQMLLDGDVASAGSCTKMVAILEQQQNGRRIGRYLPEEGIRWGSKTGSITGVTNDVGFVSSDASTVVISVFCENLADQHVGEKFIGDVARQAVAVCGIAEPLQTS